MDFVERMLDASALEAGKMVFDRRPLSLLPLIKSKVKFFASRSSVHYFQVRVPASLPLAFGDENKTGVIINNLLENAIKYSPEGGNITIEVDRSRQDGYLEVSISDEGIGIPAEYREEVFERFFRLNAGAGWKTDGQGLGLYITKALVEGQNGRIWVADRPGKGACFTFTIPQLTEEVDSEVEREYGSK
ncbi:MAG: ATP-binding protein [Chloroflexi bacterium]|nr:ATP-binding protein [Chloroflexota bacterium]